MKTRVKYLIPTPVNSMTINHLFVHNKHGDLSAILALVEDLLRLKLRGVKTFHFSLSEHLGDREGIVV